MKKFCESLREHTMKIINFEKKKQVFHKRVKESYEIVKICYTCKEIFENKYLKEKKYRKVRDHFYHAEKYRDAAHSICNLKYSIPKKSPIVSHNESKFHYHFIIKE